MVNESVDFPGFVTNCGIFLLLPGESLIFLSTVTSFLRLDTDMSSQILATEKNLVSSGTVRVLAPVVKKTKLLGYFFINANFDHSWE